MFDLHFIMKNYENKCTLLKFGKKNQVVTITTNSENKEWSCFAFPFGLVFPTKSHDVTIELLHFNFLGIIRKVIFAKFKDFFQYSLIPLVFVASSL